MFRQIRGVGLSGLIELYPAKAPTKVDFQSLDVENNWRHHPDSPKGAFHGVGFHGNVGYLCKLLNCPMETTWKISPVFKQESVNTRSKRPSRLRRDMEKQTPGHLSEIREPSKGEWLGRVKSGRWPRGRPSPRRWPNPSTGPRSPRWAGGSLDREALTPERTGWGGGGVGG